LGLADLLLQLLDGVVGVRAVVVLYLDGRDALAGVGRGTGLPLAALDGVLDGLGNVAVHDLGRGSRVSGGDSHRRQRERGDELLLERRGRVNAKRYYRYRRQRDDAAIGDAEFG
jgi:hypothetical protein